MGYGQKGKQSYSQINRGFRKSWNAGMSQATAQVETLRDKGWTVEDPVPASEARDLVKAASEMGAQTKTIPVAEWNGEMLQIIAYKPKQPVSQAVVDDIEVPEKKVKKTVDPTARFQRIFWGKVPVPKDMKDDGVMLSRDKTLALVLNNASPKRFGTFPTTVKGVCDLGVVQFLTYKGLVRATKATFEYLHFKDASEAFSLEHIKRSMKALGLSKAVRLYYLEDKPLVITTADFVGDTIISASIDASSTKEISISAHTVI